ncbi:MAG: flagellar basal body P-ring protein FlgI [Candidatus Loosdrechtia sp.]|uniref:flagellar basal body P-ring protein FlgI n=1 Tax=Candidatus Loosdrechtia sp. TaxID=3101272 RepID=UPI003A621857|nr:MAG: flagellar basal body P-ring protein FlgI [Candidatus Jettenia sp. AMX2]
MNNSIFRCILGILVLISTCHTPVLTSAYGNITTRIKDIAGIQGIRDNYLFGYGLVIGLEGTGDTTRFGLTRQLAKNVFEKLGSVTTINDLDSRNMAAVMVTAKIPPFAKPGFRMDVLISSIGDAENLRGGVLLHTALQGIDNKVYAIAQGPLSLGGGFLAAGEAQEVRKNIVTTASIPNGAVVEKDIPVYILHENKIRLSLYDADFTTAIRIMEVINAMYPDSAKAISAAEIEVNPPQEFKTPDMITLFVSRIEKLPVTPGTTAKVVINERTGTIVVGENVRISTVAVAHGPLTITITERPEVSQPSPFAPGGAETTVVPRTDIKVEEKDTRLHVLPSGVSVSEIARALNILGVTPNDLIAIFQAIKEASALHAELIIM